ncbi:hypothetical protein EZ428_23680 [Pedobacter frigiditerrae]|uniref:GRAM domain-containing protein n=1 Tax=Pedobacter frigiditerrae TaxID=2530452 RepID=A0A4R0MIT2_9SPHI|nr:hypothetical protein [Pedobacter frigiditerrae]TCC86470.1 hypothetical protein EZ428_23680 [Pedobacter frigiditerrae]
MTTEKKILLRDSFYAAVIFAVVFGIIETYMVSIPFAAVTAPIGGVLFGVFIYFFAGSKTVAKQTSINSNGEEIILSGRANHFKGAEAVGGKLYLFKGRLEFKSHGFNIQNHEQCIDIASITGVTLYNSLGIIPNGLQITTKDGKVEKFVINGRKHWKEEIEKLQA